MGASFRLGLLLSYYTIFHCYFLLGQIADEWWPTRVILDNDNHFTVNKNNSPNLEIEDMYLLQGQGFILQRNKTLQTILQIFNKILTIEDRLVSCVWLLFSSYSRISLVVFWSIRITDKNFTLWLTLYNYILFFDSHKNECWMLTILLMSFAWMISDS